MVHVLPCVNCRVRSSGRCIFSDLQESDLAPFAAGVSFAIYKRREFWLGRHSRIGCYLVCRGRAKLYHEIRPSKRLLWKILTPGDIIVAEALLRKDWYNLVAQALEELEVCFIREAEIQALLSRHAGLMSKVLKQLASDHLESQRALVRTSPYLGVEERLAYLLVHLSQDDRIAVVLPGGGQIDLALAEESLAEMVASHRVTVDRCLAKFVKRGWIERDKSTSYRIKITNVEALKGLITDLY